MIKEQSSADWHSCDHGDTASSSDKESSPAEVSGHERRNGDCANGGGRGRSNSCDCRSGLRVRVLSKYGGSKDLIHCSIDPEVVPLEVRNSI